MNIKIAHNWLVEYLETDATPNEIQKYLSLCGPSIERLENIGGDSVYDIEIISNRIDFASVSGIAQEAKAILPMFGKKASLKIDVLKKYRFSAVDKNTDDPLTVKIASPNLCSRFTAILIDNVKIAPSPDFIKNRLVSSGIKSINNVVDISNYLMMALGQPVHVFDFDKIGKATMIMRESKKGEKVTTLDEKTISLPGGDIVIEDGLGELIDLCGIMGGLNSSVTEKTKRVLLFVQTYNKEKIRKTTMTTGQRTVAASYFEKGLDEEKVEPTLVYGVELLKKYAQGKVASKIYDIYPNPYKPITLQINKSQFDLLIGVDIEAKKIISILTNLGFDIEEKGQTFFVTVPSYRKYDISIAEDLIEEVARIYGYDKLPNNLPPQTYVRQPEEFEKLFNITSKIKYFFKHLGLNEVINYSMISKDLINDFGEDEKSYLRLSNTISNEIEYMRKSLIPSLYKNVKDNTGKKDSLKFFEIAKVYIPQQNNLPKEEYRLAVATNTNFYDLKGIFESLYKELNISSLFSEKIVNKNDVIMCEVPMEKIINSAKLTSTYRPINSFALIKLDKTFQISPQLTYEVIQKKAFESKLLKQIEVIWPNTDSPVYGDKLTLRFYYSSNSKNITEEEAKAELEKVNF